MTESEINEMGRQLNESVKLPEQHRRQLDQPPSWTECPRAVCRGAVHTTTRTDPDGNTERTDYCSSCGLPTG